MVIVVVVIVGGRCNRHVSEDLDNTSNGVVCGTYQWDQWSIYSESQSRQRKVVVRHDGTDNDNGDEACTRYDRLRLLRR